MRADTTEAELSPELRSDATPLAPLLRRQERQPRPPPYNLAPLVSEPERRPHLLGCAAYCHHNLLAVPLRGRGGLEIPLQVRLFEWFQLRTNDREARFANQRFPGLAREIAAMAWVAQLLDVMQPFLCPRVVVRHAAVDQEEVSSRLEHARDLAEEPRRRTEVMRCHSRGDQIKRA